MIESKEKMSIFKAPYRKEWVPALKAISTCNHPEPRRCELLLHAEARCTA
jgi:hypothetical protein